MARLIKTWDELDGLEFEKGYRIKLEEVDGVKCYGWIVPKVETEETKSGDQYFKHHRYLSFHTFYGHQYEYSTKVLQSYGFDVEIDNRDK